MIIVARQDVGAERRDHAVEDQQPLVAMRADRSRDQVGVGEIAAWHQRSGIGGRGRDAALRPGQRIDAQHVLASPLGSGWSFGPLPRVEHQRRVGGFGKALPRQDAGGLIGGCAWRQAHRRQVSGDAQRPADDIGGDQPTLERLAAIGEQPRQMERALAVAGEDDRRVQWRLPQELFEGRAHIAIGEVERLLGIGAAQQERAVSGLAVARRPGLGDVAEGARLGLEEEGLARIGIPARRLQRSVPAVALEIGGRVNIEQRCPAFAHR